MFKDLWTLLCRVALIVGLGLTLVAVLDLVRAFAFFYRFGPVWGWSFLFVLALLLIGAALYLRSVLTAYPRVLKAPSLPPIEEASHHDLAAYCRYLAEYLERLGRNPNFSEAQSDQAAERAAALVETLGAHPLNDDLRRAAAQAEEETIRPLLKHLEEGASREVRRSVRDVMLGVSLSPYHSVDLVIVLYRNCTMILRVARFYASRPNTREQLLILRDVVRVVVTVNFLYIGRNLIENLFANVPVIGRIVDDIGQGLGAGLFTSAAGHAAMDRCAAFRGWNREQAVDSLASQTRAFLLDVRDIFTRDVLPDLRGRIRSELPADQREAPGFWDGITAGIATAIDATAGMVGQLVVRPAMAGTRTVVNAGAAVTRQVARAGNAVTRSGRRRHRRRRRIPNVFGTLRQRLKYSAPPPME